jgi:anaerobic glycerol-3-phosphate dehydrogenase
MIETIATVVITASSVVLFAYWFRYTCLLILSAKTARDFAADVAARNNLAFPGVQAQLQQASTPDLDRLRASLDNDYRALRDLLKYARNMDEQSLETQMLAVNYKVMRAWYSVSRHFSGRAAARALSEMSMVVSHFANLMGEQAAAAAA